MDIISKGVSTFIVKLEMIPSFPLLFDILFLKYNKTGNNSHRLSQFVPFRSSLCQYFTPSSLNKAVSDVITLTMNVLLT